MRYSNYGGVETIQNVIFFAISKLYIKKSRLIRFPIVIRGKRKIDFGTGLTTGRRCRIEVNGKHDGKVIVFGNDVNIGDMVRISASNKIQIGSNVLMGSRVTIVDNAHGEYSADIQDSPYTPPNKRALSSEPIIIGDNVWIGEGVVIQKGVTIGNGCIVAANSVVAKSVPAGCIVGGVPSRIIKKYDSESSKWIRCE